MTATLPQRGPSTPGGPPRVRLDARPGVVYAYTVLDHHTGLPVPDDYVGQSRKQTLRDRQHRGLAPQRDGVVREQPWADRIVGTARIVEAGVWTDAELDERERYWMGALQPRLNCRDSTTPDRIPIYTQRDQRDARDVARGLPIRDWARPAGVRPATGAVFVPRPSTTVNVRQQPSRSVLGRLARTRPAQWVWRRVCPWAAVWLALWAVGMWQGGWALQDAAGMALVGTAAAARAWWWLTTPRKKRRRRQ